MNQLTSKAFIQSLILFWLLLFDQQRNVAECYSKFALLIDFQFQRLIYRILPSWLAYSWFKRRLLESGRRTDDLV